MSRKGNIRVLLVEDSPSHAALVKRALQEPGGSFETIHVERVGEGLERLAREQVDVVLLDLHLPGCRGLDALARLRAAVPDVAVVVLTGHADDAIAAEAVRGGAQDCLDKLGLDGRNLRRALVHARERQRVVSRLRAQSLADELTGLLNRRGLLQHAERQMRLADRRALGFVVAVADVDDLKRINDTQGHAAGDAALRDGARALAASVRSTDAVARLGGDEFAVLTDEALGSGEAAGRLLAARVGQRLREQGLALSMSLGAAAYQPGSGRSIMALLQEADARMYADKERRRAGRYEAEPPAPAAAGRPEIPPLLLASPSVAAGTIVGS